jgi:hypothetical protein
LARRQYQLRDCVWYPITLEQLAIRALPRRKRDCRRGLPGRQNRRQDCIARDTFLHRVSTAAEFPPPDLACKDRDEPSCGWGDDDRVTEMKDSGSCRKGHVLQPIHLQALHAVRIEEPRARTRLLVQTRAYGSLLSLFAYGHPNQGSGSSPGAEHTLSPKNVSRPFARPLGIRDSLNGGCGSKAVISCSLSSSRRRERAAGQVNEQLQKINYSRCLSESMLPCKTRMMCTVSGVAA